VRVKESDLKAHLDSHAASLAGGKFFVRKLFNNPEVDKFRNIVIDCLRANAFVTRREVTPLFQSRLRETPSEVVWSKIVNEFCINVRKTGRLLTALSPASAGRLTCLSASYAVRRQVGAEERR